MDGNGNGKNGKNGNETKAAPERVCEGDCRVRALMRKQRLPAEGERVRKSRFAFTLDTEDGRLLFHTLTRQLLILPPGAAGLFDGDGLFPRGTGRTLRIQSSTSTSSPSSCGRKRGQTFSETVITEAASRVPISTASGMVLP